MNSKAPSEAKLDDWQSIGHELQILGYSRQSSRMAS